MRAAHGLCKTGPLSKRARGGTAHVPRQPSTPGCSQPDQPPSWWAKGCWSQAKDQWELEWGSAVLRTFIGSVLVAWSFIVIPSNLGIPGYEADLLFGFFILVFGISLIISGIGRIQQEAKNAASPRRSSSNPMTAPSRPPPASSPTSSAMVKIVGTIATGVVTGLITGAIQSGLGI
jgi:hypothetical protein